MNTFRSAGCAEITSDLELGALFQVIAAACNLCRWYECWNDVIVTIHTDYFLGYILIGFHIDTVSRDSDSKRITIEFGREVKSGQYTNDIFIRNFDSKYSVDLLYAYRKLSGLYRIACINDSL